MPIGPFESEVLHTLALQRNPDSYIGGATVLHQSPDSPRTSADIDVFHDPVEAVQRAVTCDTQTLLGAGYCVEVTSQQESFCRAIVTKGGLPESSAKWFPAIDTPFWEYQRRLAQDCCQLKVFVIVSVLGRGFAHLDVQIG